MTSRPITTARKPLSVGAWTAIYFVAYCAASALDLGTTELALRAGGAEANVFATEGGVYANLRSLAMTSAGGVVMTALFTFGIANAGRVSDKWLRRPMASFMTFYVNPWSPRFTDRSPLHAVCFAAAFALLRTLAAANNLVIVEGGVGPIGAAVRAVGRLTSAQLGLALVVGPIYIALAVLLGPVFARLDVFGAIEGRGDDLRNRSTPSR